jgi:hypothetical protein
MGHYILEQQVISIPDRDGKIAGLPGVGTFVGTKVVHAWPLTRGVYCEFRGWDLPEDEDGGDLGYLVEYTDGGPPNIPGFTGYISWSPKAVFDKAYKEV